MAANQELQEQINELKDRISVLELLLNLGQPQ